MSKSEGRDVRHAFDGPDIEHDQLIGKIERWNRDDRQRASSAGETRSDIGLFIEQSGMNNKALAMCRTIMKEGGKDGGQAKAMDVIRSLETALPMIKAHIGGQQPELDLDDALDQGAIDPEGEDLPKPSYTQNFDPATDDPELAAETDDFEKHLAAVTGQ